MKHIKLQKIALAMVSLLVCSGISATENDQDKKQDKTIKKYIDEAIKDELHEQLANMPNVEIGKGLSFMPADNSFKTTIRFRMQNTAGLTFDNDMALTQTQAEIRRLRLRFDGYVFSPKVLYTIQLGFSGNDSKQTPNGNTNIIKDAIVYYKPNSSWNFGFGQTKVKTNRALMNSSGALQFIDRSIVNSLFGGNRDFGFFGEYHSGSIDKAGISAYASVTMGEGPSWRSSTNNGFAYAGRIELFPMGHFNAKGAYTEGDTYYEEKAKLMIGAGYLYNHNACRTSGLTGSIMPDDITRNIGSYFADIVLKYRGFSFHVDFMGRYSGTPSTFGDTGLFIFNGMGTNLQASYIFEKKWELAARSSSIIPNKDTKPNVGYKFWNQSTIGLTRYLIGHNVKLQLDLSYNTRSESFSNDYDRFAVRFQVELGL